MKIRVFRIQPLLYNGFGIWNDVDEKFSVGGGGVGGCPGTQLFTGNRHGLFHWREIVLNKFFGFVFVNNWYLSEEMDKYIM